MAARDGMDRIMEPVVTPIWMSLKEDLAREAEAKSKRGFVIGDVRTLAGAIAAE